ncbi:MAG: outer membrane beta-barrel family protein [Parabacteroides sp.]|nr:outer membrane beta-barrel family protein [Parabacteroides sp.]
MNWVTVKATRPIVKAEEGKLSYDLNALKENKIIDNAFELVKELPGISTRDNSLAIVGEMGGTDILIGGRKTNMPADQMMEYLHSLPSSQVEKIEVVYNPPASWHVKGSAINIILKKENKYSLQGQLQGRYTSQYANSYQAGSSLFFSSPKVSFDLIYTFNDNRSKVQNDQLSLHRLEERQYDIQSNILTKKHSQYHNLFTGLGYTFSDKSQLKASYVGRYTPKQNDHVVSNNNYLADAESWNNKDNGMHDISLQYSSSFGLSAGAEYTRYHSDGLQTMLYDRPEETVDAFRYDMGQRINRVNGYADMSHALPQGWQMFYGVRHDYTENTNIQHFRDEEHGGQGSYDRELTTDEHITNAYVGLSKTFLDGKINASATLKGEFYKINDYKKSTLLPNAMVSYRIHPNHYLQLAYRSMRIYPSYWDRQDYETYSDEYTLHQGNPLLRPSQYGFVNLFYLLKNRYSFQFSYYRVNDFMVGQNYQLPDRLLLINKTMNMDFTTALNFTLNIPVTIAKVWSMNWTFTACNERYKAEEWYDIAFDRNKWFGLVAMNHTWTLLKAPLLTLNVDGFYKSPTIQGIWDFDDMVNLNAGLKCEVIKGKATVGFQCTDLFESTYPVTKVRYANQYLDMDYTKFRRSFMLTFTYKFKGYQEKQTKQVDSSRFGF